jgi:prenylcysteine oxidase/farnesylcysteine lyase
MRNMSSFKFTRLVLCLLLITPSFAFQLPFKIPFFKSTQAIIAEQQAAKITPRIAVIGAGAGGSSAAFWISKAKERSNIDVEVDVYERASYIGGRECSCIKSSHGLLVTHHELLGSTVVYPYDDSTYAPIELGASIFVDANKNMMRASKEFNLSLSDFGDEFADTGIWDGSKFPFVVSVATGFGSDITLDAVLQMDNSSYSKSWWTSLKILWRYGYSAPVKTQAL